MGVTVVASPTAEPITLEEAKTHLRVELDDSSQNTYINGLIRAAREFCEGRQHRAYITQTLEYSPDAFPTGNRIKLPKPPLQSVTSVTYVTEDGESHTLSPSTYVVDVRSRKGAVVLKSTLQWPTDTLAPANGVIIRYVAGYGDAAAVPERAKQAMKLLIGHWFEHREEIITGTIVTKVPMAAEDLLRQGRVGG